MLSEIVSSAKMAHQITSMMKLDTALYCKILKSDGWVTHLDSFQRDLLQVCDSGGSFHQIRGQAALLGHSRPLHS